MLLTLSGQPPRTSLAPMTTKTSYFEGVCESQGDQRPSEGASPESQGRLAQAVVDTILTP